MFSHDLPGSDADGVLFLHGLSSSGTAAFLDFARRPAFSSRRRLIPDLPGFGNSADEPAAGYRLEDHVEAVARLITQAEAAPLGIIGQGLGGSIGIMAARSFPSLFRWVIAIDPNLRAWDGESSSQIARTREADFVSRGHGALIAEATAARANILSQANPVALHRTATHLALGPVVPIAAQFAALDIPRLLIQGDAVGMPADRHYLERSGVELAAVIDAGSEAMVENPAATENVIMGWLRRIGY